MAFSYCGCAHDDSNVRERCVAGNDLLLCSRNTCCPVVAAVMQVQRLPLRASSAPAQPSSSSAPAPAPAPAPAQLSSAQLQLSPAQLQLSSAQITSPLQWAQGSKPKRRWKKVPPLRRDFSDKNNHTCTPCMA